MPAPTRTSQVREWKRGTAIAAARLVSEGSEEDVGVSGYISRHRGHRFQFVHFSNTFYTNSLKMKLPMGTCYIL